MSWIMCVKLIALFLYCYQSVTTHKTWGFVNCTVLWCQLIQINSLFTLYFETFQSSLLGCDIEGWWLLSKSFIIFLSFLLCMGRICLVNVSGRDKVNTLLLTQWYIGMVSTRGQRKRKANLPRIKGGRARPQADGWHAKRAGVSPSKG